MEMPKEKKGGPDPMRIAGRSPPPPRALTPEGWDRTLEINLRSQAMTCRAVVRQMLAQPVNEVFRLVNRQTSRASATLDPETP